MIYMFKKDQLLKHLEEIIRKMEKCKYNEISIV